MRSGVSAKTAPTDPHVQPSCFTPSGLSCRGCGQFSTNSYGPNSSCPPFSCDTAPDCVEFAEGDLLSDDALQPTSSAHTKIAKKTRIDDSPFHSNCNVCESLAQLSLDQK